MKQKLKHIGKLPPEYCFICLEHLYVQYNYTGVMYGESVARAMT